MSGSTSLTASINTAPTSNSNTGGTLSNSNSYPVSTDPPPAGGNSDKSIYLNNSSDLEYYKENPDLPSQISGNGTATISGSYSVSGGQIRIISSSNTVITFSSGIKGIISIPFNNSTISGNGTTYTYLSTLGLSDQTSPLLLVNITISINNATISNNNLSANITISFSAAFVNLDSNQPPDPNLIYAPGTILNEPFVGTITGSTGTIRTITLSKNLLTHKLK